jgi:hypothetical protein
MRSARWFVSFTLALSLAWAAASGAIADPIRVLSSDATGVTLRLDVPDVQVSKPGPDGRSQLSALGLDAVGEPGRPALPQASTLVALPQGARAVARVLEVGPLETREVRLAVGGRPVMHDDGGKLGFVPVVEPVAPIADGAWPAQAVQVGDPFTLRRQRYVAVRLSPVRYDEATSTVSIQKGLTVRVDFTGASRTPSKPAVSLPEPHWDAVLQKAVANYGEARGWRAPRETPKESALRMLQRTQPVSRTNLATRAAASPAAFDEQNPEVRVLVDTTGVVAFPYASLSQNGFPSGIAVNRVSVHRHEFVEGANPPYVTYELPIEVDDADSDGVFDHNDRIVLFVQNWAERSRASMSQREWGDGEAVFATFLTGNGLRVPQRSGWLDQTLTALTSYRTRAHFEKSQYYINTVYVPGFQPTESDTNTDLFVWTNVGFSDPTIDNFLFETNDLDNTRPVTMRLQWQGMKRNDHRNWADVRNAASQLKRLDLDPNSPGDSIEWVGRITLTTESGIPGTALSEGLRNTLRIWGETPGSEASGVVNTGLDWFEVEYARRFKAIAGRLSCTSDSSGGPFQIRATNFTSRAIRVYDVTDSLSPVRLTIADSLITGSGNNIIVRFQDNGIPGGLKRYVVFDQPKPIPPGKFSPVTRQNLAGKPASDYLLITPEAFLSAAQKLATQRRSQGLSVLVCPLEAINDEFNGGRKSSHAIRRFLKFADASWGSSFVMILGDGSEDPQNFTGTAGPDLVPVQRIAGPVGIPEETVIVNELVVSDPWYVWCLDCPSSPVGPRLHDMYIGRMPVATPEQADAIVDKLVKYEQITPDQTWRRKMLILADDQFSTQSFFGGGGGTPSYCFKTYEGAFIQISNIVHDVVLDEGGLAESDVEVFDLAQYLSGVPTYQDPVYGLCRSSWRDTQDYTNLSVTPQVFDRINDGRLWWNFQGHANPYVLTHEDLYRNLGVVDDVYRFQNVDKPTFFSAFSCHPNAFGTVGERNPQLSAALGEDMVLLPDRGAIASWASSGYELLPTDPQHHLNVHLARALFVDPPSDVQFGAGGARVMLGEAIALTLVRNLVTVRTSAEAEVGITYNLLGDPATRLSIGAPQAIVTANQLPVTSGDPVRLHTVGDTVRVDADLVSNVRIRTITLDRRIGNTTTTIPPTDYTITPPFPDSGAASQGGRRFHLAYHTMLGPDTYTYTLRSTDLNGVTRTFDILFRFQTVLRADGTPIGENESVSPNAQLSLLVYSPVPLALPSGLQVTLNNTAVAYTFVPANGDASGREWILTITNTGLATGDYVVQVSAPGGATERHTFLVEPGSDHVSLRNAFAFPNPFDEQQGTNFSFRLIGPSAADVQIRVYSVTGKLLYRRTEYGVVPGYHQFAWNGLDAEGQALSNGMYIYKLAATNGSTDDVVQGRLIKLRRPHHAEEETTP